VSSSVRAVAARRIAVGAIAVLGAASFVWLAVRGFRYDEVASVLASAKPWPWLPLAVASYVGGHLARGYRCKLLVQRDARMTVGAASNIVVAGYAGNNVLPARLGELVRAGMLVSRTGVPLVQALTITGIERLFDAAAIFGLLGASFWLAQPAPWMRPLVETRAWAFGIALALAAPLVLTPGVLLSVASRLSLPAGPRWHARLLAVTTHVVNGASALRDLRCTVSVAAASLVAWTFEAGMFVFVLPALGLALDPVMAVLSMATTNLAILAPSTPGFIGPFHEACARVAVSQGVAPTVAISYAVLVHLTFYVTGTLWGATVMMVYGVRAAGHAALLYAASRARPTKDLAGLEVAVIARIDRHDRSARPTRFDRALVLALLPDEHPVDRSAAIEEAVHFTVHAVKSLPSRLRFMFGCGMLAFRMFTVVRYGKPFVRLAPDRRRRAVSTWAFGPIGPMRQLFRPIRSTALLAYFEHGAERGAQAEGHRLKLLARASR